MFGSEVLDVAIGLVLVYAVLSLVASALKELLESFLKSRARLLERGIRELLGDQGPLTETMYNHALIGGLFNGHYQRDATTRNLPSYIPARSFSLALLDTATSGTPTDTFTPRLGGFSPQREYAGVQLERLRDEVLRHGLFPPQTKQALVTLIDAAGDDPNQVRKNIEEWFNSAMDRVSGHYRRQAQWVLFGIGLALTVAINADTLSIVGTLSTGRATRTALAAIAEQYAKPDAAASGVASPTSLNQFGNVDAMLQRIEQSGHLVGWPDPRGSLLLTPGQVAQKIFGLLLTAVAITMGAPFWFDLLNKIVIVRSTIKPHEKSPEEASKA